MTPTPTFWCEPNGRARRYFRCYQTRAVDDPTCPHYCNAMKLLDEVEGEKVTTEDGDWHWRGYSASDFPWEAFPTACDKCGREMTSPERQIFMERLFVAKTGPRAGEVFGDRELPLGAMWDCEWRRDYDKGADGMSVQIQLPDGVFCPDARASNCTLPDDKTHKCWVRHGDPKTGYVHIDKNGVTCAAGAGSIWQHMPKGFHGFVHRGFIVDAGDQPTVDRMLDASNPIAPAERVVSPIVMDVAKAAGRRTVVAKPSGVPTPSPTRQHAWRSNRGHSLRKKLP